MKRFFRRCPSPLFAARCLRIIGVLLFFWILSRIDLRETAAILLSARPGLFAAALLAFFFVFPCRAARLHILIRAVGFHISLAQTWRIYNLGIFLAGITPGKIGEFGRAVYFRQEGMTRNSALALGVFDRVLDQVVALATASAAIAILFGPEWLLPGVCTVGMLIFFLYIFLRGSPRISKAKPPPLAPVHAIHITLLTFAGWFFHYLGAALLSWSVGVPLDAITIFAVFNLSVIVTSLPVAPAGLGTREATLITLLHIYGISAPYAVATSQLMLMTGLFLILPGFVYWMRERG